jgi:hypothetical protein
VIALRSRVETIAESDMALYVVVILGIVTRMINLNQSLSVDEAWLANSVLTDSLHEVFYYDTWLQTSALLFLLLVCYTAMVRAWTSVLSGDRILVTGGTGFTWGDLCERLARDGHSVRALVRYTKSVRRVRSVGRPGRRRRSPGRRFTRTGRQRRRGGLPHHGSVPSGERFAEGPVGRQRQGDAESPRRLRTRRERANENPALRRRIRGSRVANPGIPPWTDGSIRSRVLGV